MANYTDVTFNGVTLHITNVTPASKQKKKKSIIGKTLVETTVIGLNDTQWELALTGVVTGTDLTDLGTNRAALEVLDDSESHAYVDGIHDGTYYMRPGSLSFEDSGDNANSSYRYTCTLVEE